jgi:SAM-dependent methyltransferase
MSSHANPQFENAEFWDERYRTNLDLGSGGGSRGEHLRFKRRLLQDLIGRLRPASILDVGCGDIEVTKGLDFEGHYTGVDLSPFIVDRNRAIRPDWEFLQGDFLALSEARNLKADLVLCLDVLIHQHDLETYRAFTRSLYEASQRALIVNGFDAFPRSGRLSPNVAYHEPISQTLRALGAETIEPLATFRRTAIMLVARNGRVN